MFILWHVNEIVLLQQEMYMIIAAFSDLPGAATLDSDVPASKLRKSLWVCVCVKNFGILSSE